MKFTVAGEHKNFFQKNKCIEFESVLTLDEIERLSEAISRRLAKLLSIPVERISSGQPQKKFESGRDLWRHSTSIRSLSCNRKLGELAYELSGERPIRIGYDQYFPAVPLHLKLERGKYYDFLSKPGSLKDFSSIQGILCGVVIALEDSEDSEKEETFAMFPKKQGNIMILHPEAEIDWPAFLEFQEKDYYIVVFAAGKSIYVRNKKDPLPGSLIEQGYSSGDRLLERANPIIFR